MKSTVKQTLAILVVTTGLAAACRQQAQPVDPEPPAAEAQADAEQTQLVAPEINARTGIVNAEPFLRIRAAASTDAPVIYDAPDGTQLDILDETTLGDRLWYQVKARSDELPQELGWAASRYIVLSDRTVDAVESSSTAASSLTMACTNTLSNNLPFTVAYSSGGFSQMTLDPSGANMSASLTPMGKTDAQHDVWEGPLGESTVRVIHMSTTAPEPGDEIYVVYNEFTGRATCR